MSIKLSVAVMSLAGYCYNWPRQHYKAKHSHQDCTSEPSSSIKLDTCDIRTTQKFMCSLSNQPKATILYISVSLNMVRWVWWLLRERLTAGSEPVWLWWLKFPPRITLQPLKPILQLPGEVICKTSSKTFCTCISHVDTNLNTTTTNWWANIKCPGLTPVIKV